MLTLLLLNVSMTLSASPASEKPISAMTVGCAAISLQNCSSPLTLRITLSMSAAVVPGAKLLAITAYGPPAAPLMLMLPPFAAAFFPALLFLGTVASLEVSLAARWLLLLEIGGRVGPRPLRGVALFERGIDAVRLVTPTRLARLPPMGAFFVLFAAPGALWRRFLPKMSCASCSFLRFWRA